MILAASTGMRRELLPGSLIGTVKYGLDSNNLHFLFLVFVRRSSIELEQNRDRRASPGLIVAAG